MIVGLKTQHKSSQWWRRISFV